MGIAEGFAGDALLKIKTAEIGKIDVQDQAARGYGRQLREKRLRRFEQERRAAPQAERVAFIVCDCGT